MSEEDLDNTSLTPEEVARFRRALDLYLPVTTGGSQAPEAEALLKGQPHDQGSLSDGARAHQMPEGIRPLASVGRAQGEDARTDSVQELRSMDNLGAQEKPSPEVGGSDAARLPTYNHTRGDSALTPCPECAEGRSDARLQQIRKRHDDNEQFGRKIEVSAPQVHRDRGWLLEQYDAQALALRTVREERDEALRSEDAAGDGWGEAVEANKLVLAEMLSLRADVERLTSERDEARVDVVRMATTKVGEKCEHHRQPLEVIERLALRECPICWKVCAEHAEQQVRALRTSIEQLQRHRYMLRIDAGLRVEEMFVVWDEVKALVSAAIKEP